MTLSEKLSHLTRRIAGPGHRLSMGDLAALRRMESAPERAALVLYALLLEIGVPLEHAIAVSRWRTIVLALALAHGAHDPSRPIGDALVALSFSEQRLTQLLSADTELLPELATKLARRLHAQQVRMNFAALARLLLAESGEDIENARLDIARSFVIAAHKDGA